MAAKSFGALATNYAKQNGMSTAHAKAEIIGFAERNPQHPVAKAVMQLAGIVPPSVVAPSDEALGAPTPTRVAPTDDLSAPSSVAGGL